jgi:hypothetical protein
MKCVVNGRKHHNTGWVDIFATVIGNLLIKKTTLKINIGNFTTSIDNLTAAVGNFLIVIGNLLTENTNFVHNEATFVWRRRK